MRMNNVRSLLIALLTAFVSAIPLQAQETGEIRGRVVDADFGEPLIDVLVSVADRTVLTDASGSFVVTDVPAGTYTLMASRIGFRDASQEVTVVSGQTASIEVRMEVRPIGLDDIVVTGYGERQVRDLTGVIANVSAEEFNTGRIISTEQLIQGKVAGVQVVDDAEPGGGVSIRIRGATSVTSSNEPLYVLDGVPLQVGSGIEAGARNPLSFLNPDDIESITILKDASSAAIYGSQGANGVVMITTKTGAPGARFQYRGSVSGSFVVGQPDMLNAEQFRQAVQEHAPDRLSVLGNENTDWRDAVQRSAFGQEHSLAVSGGTEGSTYRVSMGYLNQEGVVQGSEVERISLSLAYNQDLLDESLNIQVNTRGSRTNDLFTPIGVLGQATAFAPTQPMFDENSETGFYEWEDPLGVNNPLAELDLISDEAIRYRSVGNVTAEYAFPFLDGLSVTGRLGYDVGKFERKTFEPSVLRSQQEGGEAGTVTRVNNTGTSWTVDLYGNFNRTFGTSNIDLTGGYAWAQSRDDDTRFFAQQISFDQLGPDGVPGSEIERTFIFVEEIKFASFFGRVNYTLLDRYLLTASLRRDRSSKFGPDEQWGWFPSAAVAWRLSDEDFVNWDALSDLKLRASWGITGNQAFDSYQAFKSFFIGDALAQAQFGDEFVTTIRPSAADPGIKWEQTESWNVGLDYGFFNNRLSGSFEYYWMSNEDLIFTVPVAAGTNLSNFVTTNIGDQENRGFEAAIDALIFEGRDGGFSWDASFNVSTNDNEIVQINPFGGGEVILTGGIAGGIGSNIQVIQPGSPINSFFVLRHIRDSNGDPIYEDTNGDGNINDNDLYEDQNGDGVINQDDRTPFKSPDPDWGVGHTSLMSYRNFDLSFTLTAQIGNYVYNNIASANGFFAGLRDSNAPPNLHVSVLENGFQDEQFFSDAYIEDASFLRMNNIELGYSFITGPLEGLRLFGTVQNVFTLTGYSGIDPTAGINGIDNNIFPRSRTFTAGLSYDF